MNNPTQANRPPWLVWVFSGEISKVLDAATWLEMTKEMRQSGWKVDLISAGPDGKKTVQDVEVFCINAPDFYFIRHLVLHMRIIPYILQNWKQIDIVLFNQISLLWFLPLRLLNLFRKDRPLFIMDTRTVPMESIQKMTMKDRLRGRFYFLMNNLANRLSDGQTVITQHMADLLHIPSNKLLGVWPSGVNLEKFAATWQHRDWPATDTPLKVIYIGTLNYERNLMTFCKAILEANQCGMNFSFLMVGDGSEKQDLQTFANQTNGVIQVSEPVPHGQIPDVLAKAHIGVLPFPDEEKYRVSSPIKLFEYMGAGLPILATKITCHTDVIGNGDYVFWADTSDQDGLLKALEATWQRRYDLPQMGSKAQVAAQDWTYAASARRLQHALQHGLSQKHGKVYLARTA